MKTFNRLLWIFIVLVAHAMQVRAQGSQDYVIVNAQYMQGNVVRVGDVIQFQKTTGSAAMSYQVADVEEYSESGKVFQRIEPGGELVRRLVSGNLDLFAGKGGYVIRNADSKLTSLDRDNFRPAIEKELNCTGSDPRLPYVKFNRASLENYFKASNAVPCSAGYFPYSKFGMMAGYSLSRVTVTEFTSTFIQNVGVVAAGIFYNIPLYKGSFYLSPELYFTHMPVNFSSSAEHFSLTIDNFNLPVNLKWVAGSGRLKPYFKGGINVQANLVKPTSFFYRKSGGQDTYDILHSSNEFVLGYNGSGGFEYELSNRRNLHFEVRFTDTLPANTDSVTDLSAVVFLLGFSF